MIQLDKLSKSYGQKQVLVEIDATFNPGQVYGIVGENGAGKTTLFKCLAGLELHEGDVKSNYPILKNELGFLPTDPYFFSKITGREYLQLFCNARDINGVDLNSKNIFDLPLDKYASIYSTGMQKKLALTAILIQNNDCYILDEPFNGVDIQSNMIIIEIIKKLKSLNKIVIISSHIFSTLAEVCDEIYLLKEGQFERKVIQAEFGILEKEMKDFTIGNIIEKLELE